MEPHPGYYSIPVNVQDYQSIVDEIMAQSRKGTDFGLDLGDFEMLDTLGRCPPARLVRSAARGNIRVSA